ncbi:class I SAM-dependent methyltransferase [Streptomonospora sp. PA3]|uniref:class I SAM-dependent methyltransferase n=1 Tax=Streptomonospora sp. PA3 TaxID=2607326 RepID=UPI0012DC9AB9|nr:class I SAM-dependent methyltransferase [Streptomonospora sp. PA3]MUL39985.1 class I SAM-dependent methyltransferase [Streptomonospora sp. PA3]
MTTADAFEDIKAKQQQTWSSGDYNRIAWLTVPLADRLCDAVDLRPGSRVLDVATGTGHVALAAARRFCDVTGIDYVPRLVETARRRAAAESLPVRFEEADAERLPFADAEFDYVLSAIGVMFTADHRRAAGELVRVCKPGGVIGLLNWTPEGFVGRLLATVSGHVPPPAGAQPPVRWGSEEVLRELLGDRVSRLGVERGSVTQRFLSPEHFASYFVEHYGPTLKAAQRLTEDGRRTFHDDLAAVAEASGRTDGGALVSDWEYLIAVATRA